MKLRDKVYAYESLLGKIHAYRVMGNTTKVLELLDLISAWTFAYRCNNGQQSDKECQRNIDSIIERMGG